MSENDDIRGWTPIPPSEFAAELARSHPRYQVQNLIGFGGMGAVYLAVDRETSARVAIKKLRWDALHDPRYTARFDREIECLRKMNHRNVIRILDAGRTPDGYPFFVMEYIEGPTLSDTLADKARLSLQRVVEIMEGICAGVQHAHEAGVVHRDLNARNVIVEDGTNRVVVLDFGIARDMTAQQTTHSLHQVPGTEGHIAPEVRAGKPATVKSDVFSLGVIFCQMLTGEIPDVKYREPSDVGYDPRFDKVVGDALRQDPADRYKSAKELASAIAGALRPASDYPQQESIPMPSSPSAADHTPAAGPMEVSFADAIALQRHKNFFKAYLEDERPIVHQDNPQADEVWTSLAWDASHEVPRSLHKVNPPHLVAWSPKGDLLFTACCAWDFRFGWTMDEEWGATPEIIPTVTPAVSLLPSGAILTEFCRKPKAQITSTISFMTERRTTCAVELTVRFQPSLPRVVLLGSTEPQASIPGDPARPGNWPLLKAVN